MGHVRLEQIAQVAAQKLGNRQWIIFCCWAGSAFKYIKVGPVHLMLHYVLWCPAAPGFEFPTVWLTCWLGARIIRIRAGSVENSQLAAHPSFNGLWWRTLVCSLVNMAMFLLQLGEHGRGGGWCWDTGTWGGDGVCMLGAGPGAGAIPGWRDRDGTVTSGAGTSGAGPGGGLTTGGAAACAVMANSIASKRADMDDMTATNVCKALPTLLAALMELLIMVLEPADDAVVVVIIGLRQLTEVVGVMVVATVW